MCVRGIVSMAGSSTWAGCWKHRRDHRVEVDQVRDPMRNLVGRGGDDQPRVAVPDEGHLGEILLVEQPDDVPDVGVEPHLGTQQMRLVTEAGQWRRGPLRFTELKRAIEGISQRMLTVTLRGLERDGILIRTVRNVMPPHVSYELTPMGKTLREATAPLLEWSIAHLPHIDAARAEYDLRIESGGWHRGIPVCTGLRWSWRRTVPPFRCADWDFVASAAGR
jgi:DNA-binding HxlR family transcriptional regulator